MTQLTIIERFVVYSAIMLSVPSDLDASLSQNAFISFGNCGFIFLLNLILQIMISLSS